MTSGQATRGGHSRPGAGQAAGPVSTMISRAGRPDGGAEGRCRDLGLARKSRDGKTGFGVGGGGRGRRRSTQRDEIICVELSHRQLDPMKIVDAGDDEVTSAAWEERKWLSETVPMCDLGRLTQSNIKVTRNLHVARPTLDSVRGPGEGRGR